LILQLNPWTCLFLFVVYGVIFEALYIRYLESWRSYKRIPASNISVILFVLNLWGLSEALKSNVYYIIPIAFGTWIGNFVQITIEKRKSERKEKGGAGTSSEI